MLKEQTKQLSCRWGSQCFIKNKKLFNHWLWPRNNDSVFPLVDFFRVDQDATHIGDSKWIPKCLTVNWIIRNHSILRIMLIWPVWDLIVYGNVWSTQPGHHAKGITSINSGQCSVMKPWYWTWHLKCSRNYLWYLEERQFLVCFMPQTLWHSGQLKFPKNSLWLPKHMELQREPEIMKFHH